MNKILSYKAHQSRLTQPRGLKYRNECWVGETYAVEAYAASWIEISKSLPILAIVEAYAASWIEIQQLPQKRQIRIVEAYAASWIEIPENEKELSTEPVEAYAASWIEIYSQYL